MELGQNIFPLGGTEGAEITHNHQDEMKAIICFKI